MLIKNTDSDLIIKLHNLAEFAKRGDIFFPDELCNVISSEFNLSAVVLFHLTNNKLTILGKSGNTKSEIILNTDYSCAACKYIFEKEESLLYNNSDCQIRISNTNSFEYCSLIKPNASSEFLIKISSLSDFTENEKEVVNKIIQLTAPFINYWLSGHNLRSENENNILKLIDSSAKEIKNNANSILGYSNIIGTEGTGEINSEHIAFIKKNAQSILLNINDLNEIIKVEYNNLTFNRRNIDLEAFVNEILDLFKRKLGNKKIDFILTYSPSLSNPVFLDDSKLRYIFSNLLFLSANLADDGEIKISIDLYDNSSIKFIINPVGKQIPNQLMDRLFEPFTLVNKYPGLSGLSLPLIKKYVNYMGGNIAVSNNQDKGINFIFTISGAVMSGIESTISKLPKPTGKNRVLVIEDDYATSKLLNNYLNKWGYNPVIVSTEEQAFEIIKSEQLLAVILDIELPNTNGLELLKNIHDHPNTKNVPVIVCSIEPEQQKAFMMGAVEYFVKPINYNYLVEVLTSYKLRKDSNILCVDDDLPTLNLVKQAIESAGFNAVAENVSANVVELIKDKDIDLAIVDLDMPAPNGFELIKIIKSDKRFAHLPIIIYTGKENYKEDLKSIEGLFEDLLEKRSTNIEDLADTISAMINRYEVPPPQEEVLAKKGGTKILLAEDYKHSQIIVTRLLKKNNFEDIVVVENGEDAVKMARDQAFDLILMDMQMPIMNGFEATESIRQLPEYRTTPIIALTAFAMKGDREKCLEAGATDYIPKPIDSKEFIDKVKYYTNAT